MSFLITTTGTLSPVVLHDMGARTFVHPTTNFDLEPEYSIDELSLSVDLQNALDLGYITVEYNGRSVASSVELKEVSTPFSALDVTYDNSVSLLSAINIQSAIDEIIARTTPTTTGGTGLTSYATGDILYASAPNVLSKLPIGLDGYTLTIVSGLPTWAASAGGTVTSVSGTTNRITSTGGTTPVIDIAATYVGQTSITTLGTIATGVWNGTTIAIANGGTGATTALAAFNALSPLTTKGDLLTRNATNNIRIPVGTNGQVLVADSTQASGMKWASADAIAGQPMRFLSANTANSNAVANTTVETNFASNGTNYAMPANTPNTNSLMRFLVYGKFSTKSGAVGTLTIRLKIGSTILVANVVSPGSAITNSGFQFTGQMQFRTIGASGTVYSHLLCVFNAAGSSGSTTYCKSSNGTATIDTTVVNTIQMSAQWSTASTSNTITIEQATFEILN